MALGETGGDPEDGTWEGDLAVGAQAERNPERCHPGVAPVLTGTATLPSAAFSCLAPAAAPEASASATLRPPGRRRSLASPLREAPLGRARGGPEAMARSWLRGAGSGEVHAFGVLSSCQELAATPGASCGFVIRRYHTP